MMGCYLSVSGPPATQLEPTGLEWDQCTESGMYWIDTAANYSNYYSPPGDTDGATNYEFGACAFTTGVNYHGYDIAPSECVSRGHYVAIEPNYYAQITGIAPPGQSDSGGSGGDTETVPLTIEDLLLPQRVPAEQYELVFNAFFFLPLTAYLVAWGYQTVISFFATKD